MGQADRGRNPQTPPRLAGHAGHGFVSHFRFQQHGLAVAQITFADGGEFQLARGALQQPGAEAFFKLGNAP
ncbi:hypothetical protein D9M71_824880 [compost metagenome]